MGLEKAGFKPQVIRTTADVKLEKQGKGFAITTIALTTSAKVDATDAEKFRVAETKKNCRSPKCSRQRPSP